MVMLLQWLVNIWYFIYSDHPDSRRGPKLSDKDSLALVSANTLMIDPPDSHA